MVHRPSHHLFKSHSRLASLKLAQVEIGQNDQEIEVEPYFKGNVLILSRANDETRKKNEWR